MWFATGWLGSMRSRTSAQLCGMLTWWARRHGANLGRCPSNESSCRAGRAANRRRDGRDHARVVPKVRPPRDVAALAPAFQQWRLERIEHCWIISPQDARRQFRELTKAERRARVLVPWPRAWCVAFCTSLGRGSRGERAPMVQLCLRHVDAVHARAQTPRLAEAPVRLLA